MHGTVHAFVNNPTWKVLITYQRLYAGCKQRDAVTG